METARCLVSYIEIYHKLIIINIHVTGESDLNDVVRKVIKLNAGYYSLGGALGLLPAELNAIKSRYDQDLKQALNEVILV